MKLLIKPTEISDAKYLTYRNDKGVWSNLGDPHLFSIGSIENWLKNLSRSSARFSIFACKSWAGELSDINTHLNGDAHWEFCGLIRIDQIDENNRNCLVGMDIIPEFQGKGIAKNAYKWLLNYLFNDMNMNALYLEVLDVNKKAHPLYEKLGFKECGRWPQRVFRGGEYHDYISMSLLRQDYNKKE